MTFLVIFSLVSSLYCASATHFRNLDDSVLFPINWAGHNANLDLLDSPDYEKLTLVSANQEEFHCILPLKYGEVEDDSSSYKGPGPLSLLLPSLRKMACTHKFESYWSYDVCHGNKITQYHKDSESVRRKDVHSEYLLGVISPENFSKLEETAKVQDAELTAATDIGETTVDGVSIPYYAIEYTDGSICSLTRQARVARVLHVCYERGRNDVYSVKETTTCEYEIVVLSDALCGHPLYRKKEAPVSPVHCMPTVPGLRRPLELINVESRSLKLRMMPLTQLANEQQDGKVNLGKVRSDFARIKLTTENEGAGNKEAEEKEDDEDDDDGFSAYTDKGGDDRKKAFPPKPQSKDQIAAKLFLSGDNCLDGGVGWWQFEFCYGRSVTQYHQRTDGSKLTVLLGSFDEAKHIEWIKQHPTHAPNKHEVTHFYSDGAVCDVTGTPRTVQVLLKCNPPTSRYDMTAVALWLTEPEPCKYILGVETGMVCDLVQRVDQYGLLGAEIVTKSESKTETQPQEATDDVPDYDSNGGDHEGGGSDDEHEGGGSDAEHDDGDHEDGSSDDDDDDGEHEDGSSDDDHDDNKHEEGSRDEHHDDEHEDGIMQGVTDGDTQEASSPENTPKVTVLRPDDEL